MRVVRHSNLRWYADGEPQHLLVADGRVLARSGDPAMFEADVAEGHDHGGRWLLPAFVDAHCHVLPTGLDLLKLHLGSAESHADVLDLVRDRHREQPEGWLLAVHYDQNRYGGVHLTRDDLDRISPDRPILLRHANGHASVSNSAALAAAGVDESTPNPTGGSFERDAGGRLNGVLLEDAHERVTNAAPMPTLDEMVDAILRAGESMRAYGIGMASDMMTGRFDLLQELEAYRIAANRGCAVGLRLYLQWKTVFGPRAVERERIAPYRNLGPALKIAGVKIFADGAFGSATAAIYGRYTGAPLDKKPFAERVSSNLPSEGPEVSGQLIYAPEKLRQMVRIGAEAGDSVCVHAIGDYAVDLVLDAFEATEHPARHRLEHAMLLSDAQIERIARIGCPVAFQPEFLLRFQRSYERQLGPERAAGLKRSRSVLDAGIPLSFNSDRPIVGGDPWDGIRAAVHRPEGFDPAENCTVAEAIEAYTVRGSLANGDGREFGSLEPGSAADFQILDALPVEP